MNPKNELPPIKDWPLYWFAALERALAEGDHQAAALAQRELERLGVTVRYGGRQTSRAKGGSDATR